MPKRTHEEKIEHYLKKLRRLQQKYPQTPLSGADDFYEHYGGDEAYDPGALEDLNNAYSQGGQEDLAYASSDLNYQIDDLTFSKEGNTIPPAAAGVPEKRNDGETAHTQPQAETLDPEILAALGEATDPGPLFGDAIHNNLTQLWQPLLKKGMEKSVKEKYLKECLIPSNCQLLQAPKLNIEISSAVTEAVRVRDKRIESGQQQLGAGITAVSKALSLLLEDTSGKNATVVRHLSNGCRILCDLHRSETQARIKMITPGLTKTFMNVIQDSERDETLFGADLPEKIKASKTIEKQGLQIKKTTIMKSQVNLSGRPQFQGNWNGPSRSQANRGGRGGGPRRSQPLPPRRPPAAATQSHGGRPNMSSNRSRAPTRR